MTDIKVGSVWNYKLSLRVYTVLAVAEGNVYYTTFVLSPAYGKVFQKTISQFREDFSPYRETDEAALKEAVSRQLKLYKGIL